MPADMKAKALEIALENERAKKTEPIKQEEKPPEKETESITPEHVDSGVVTTRPSKALTRQKLDELYADGEIDFKAYQEGLLKV